MTKDQIKIICVCFYLKKKNLQKINLAIDYSQHNSINLMRHSNNLEQDDDDTISIAETDFNEPWDSNAWENLLDLARFGDEKSTTATAIKSKFLLSKII